MPSDPTLLAFDTSAAHCAAALLSGGHAVAERHEVMTRGQAERLFPLLEDVLTSAGRSWDDLDAIAVGVGPGNFTGIRIAVSAARGLALGLGKPALGVSTLEAQAFGAPRPCRAVADARQGRVYAQVFDGTDHPPELLGEEALPQDIPIVRGLSPTALVRAIGEIAAARLLAGAALSRPTPLYIRSADAAPASDPPPVILP